jgi:nucleotide-binding universal stress UspA family protein
MDTAPYRILVPVDLIDASPQALHTAQELAKRLRGEVVLLHVYRLPEYTYPGMNGALFVNVAGAIKDAACKALEELAEAAGGLRALLREGDPASEILRAIDEEQPSLVVMGTHGRKGFSRLLLGSVTERVIRRSSVPVMAVRTEDAEHSATRASAA